MKRDFGSYMISWWGIITVLASLGIGLYVKSSIATALPNINGFVGVGAMIVVTGIGFLCWRDAVDKKNKSKTGTP
jgi:hypothetical protein